MAEREFVADWFEATGLVLAPWQRQLLDDVRTSVRSAAELHWAGVRAARAEREQRRRWAEAFNRHMAQFAQERRHRVSRMHTMYGRRRRRG